MPNPFFLHLASKRHLRPLALTGFLVAALPSLPASLPENLTLNTWIEQAFDSNVYRVNERTNAGPVELKSSLISSLHATLGYEVTAHTNITYSLQAQAFWNASTENNIRQNLSLRHRGELSPSWTFGFSSTQTRIDGDKEALEFFQDRNAWATVFSRERRNQWQNRSNAHLTWRGDRWGVRTFSSLLYYDLQTEIRVPAVNRYQNYVDRYEVMGGVDLNFFTANSQTFFTGLRHGYYHQGIQGRLPNQHRSFHFERIAFGWKGTLAGRLRADIEAGPVFQRFANNTNGARLTINRFYSQSRLSFDLTDGDRLTLAYAETPVVASTGLLSARLASTALNWSRKINPRWESDVMIQARGLDYDGTVSFFNDWNYTYRLGLIWKPESNRQLGFDLERQLARDKGAGRPDREFNNTSVSLRFSQAF